MGLLTLFGRIGLNAAPFDATLKNVDQSVTKFSNRFTQKVGGIAAGFFGLNRIRTVIMQAMDRAEEINRLAGALNLTTDEVQLLQEESARTGKSISEMTRNVEDLEATLSRLRGGDVIFSREQVEQLSNAREILKSLEQGIQIEAANILEDPLLLVRRMLFPLLGTNIGGPEPTQLTQRQVRFLEMDAARKRQAEADRIRDAEIRQQESAKHQRTQDDILKMESDLNDQIEKNRASQLTDEEKLQELMAQRLQLQHDILFALTEEDTLRIRLKQAQTEGEILKLDSRISKDTAADRTFLKPISLSDSLSSIGNFLGTNPASPQMKELSTQTQVLRKIEQNTARQAESPFPL